ncbi:hypothetical protein Patl1_03961 [Pistacia atlantica]|uniref:Uncharacterized protein n=1 Tax=Pistacia atlantica TaxID=434234 RepID=A0ACC1BRY1_9ROSI|nr:hypothetical protein Patl1_03961 [Pistacia atlantica]
MGLDTGLNQPVRILDNGPPVQAQNFRALVKTINTSQFTRGLKTLARRIQILEKMEGNRSSSQSQQHRDLLQKIKEFTRSIVKDLSEERSPLIFIKRFRNYCTSLDATCACSSDLSKGCDILTLERQCHVHRIDVLLRVLLAVQQLLQENRHGSKRDIYYMHPSVFSEQSIVDRAINDICILLQCSRHNLNVVSVGKGPTTFLCLLRKSKISLVWHITYWIVEKESGKGCSS